MRIDPHTFVPYLVTVVLLIVVLRRAASSRTVKIERLWIWPTLLVLAAAAMLAGGAAPGPTQIAVLAALFCGGAVVGWWRGGLSRVEIDPDTRELTSHMSPAGVMAVAALFLARYFVRTLAAYQPGSLSGGGQGRAGMFADGLVVFGVGLVATQQLELWLRCRKLLAEASAAG